jgi:hypothetical protein
LLYARYRLKIASEKQDKGNSLLLTSTASKHPFESDNEETRSES